MSKRSGFTLIEVCVALAVLSFGVLAFGFYLDAFNRYRTAERNQAKAFIEATRQMEQMIKNPPVCGENALAQFNLRWVEVESVAMPPAHTVHFRRLVQCR